MQTNNPEWRNFFENRYKEERTGARARLVAAGARRDARGIQMEARGHLRDGGGVGKSFAAIKARIPELAAYKGALAQSPEKMLEFFRLRDELSIELGKLYVYANMKSHEDTGDSKQQGPANRVSALAVEFSAAASYVTPEILAMDEDKLKEFIAAPCLAEYAFPLCELLRRKAHVLTEAEELILARSGDMAQTADNAFSMLTNADMEFPPIRDEEGKK